jgi:ribosomal-protein-alanine N-acetyltransferase
LLDLRVMDPIPMPSGAAVEFEPDPDPQAGPVAAAPWWRRDLPRLAGVQVHLRELRREDAGSLLVMLADEEVTRHIARPPTTRAGFERVVDRILQLRMAGAGVCFAIVPRGMETAAGIFQVRQRAPGFQTAEWSFALGTPFWGTGVFAEGALLVQDFLFREVGLHRLEARVALENMRGNGALRKLGAVQEGILRGAFLRHGRYHDQILWSILKEDWIRMRECGRSTVH